MTCATAAAAVRAKDWTDEEADAKSERSKRLGLRPGDRWAGRHWTPAMDALLGTEPDEAVAAKVGKPASAVRVRRAKLGIKSARDRRVKLADSTGSAP